jgi:3-oxoacyl-[acyl-carrier protein] reductase
MVFCAAKEGSRGARIMELHQVKAIVTGAGGGLGGAFALELARAGAQVTAGDLQAAGLRRIAAEAAHAAEAGAPGRISTAILDITDEASVAAFVATAAEQMAGLNVLINSAGIARDGLLIHPRPDGIHRLPLAQWRKVVDVNLTGQFLMTREFAAAVVAAGTRDAAVVNLSSIARAGNPGQSNYAASKAGLDACTRTWALELAPHGIRVGGIAPGVTETGFLDGFSEDAIAGLKAAVPLGRLALPGEIWQGVRFILECDFFTGRTLEVDGGAIMGSARTPQ